MTVTSEETVTSDWVAAYLGVTTAAVRQMVARGTLTPLRPGARPLAFHEVDVWRVKRQRQGPTERAAVTSLVHRWQGA